MSCILFYEAEVKYIEKWVENSMSTMQAYWMEERNQDTSYMQSISRRYPQRNNLWYSRSHSSLSWWWWDSIWINCLKVELAFHHNFNAILAISKFIGHNSRVYLHTCRNISSFLNIDLKLRYVLRIQTTHYYSQATEMGIKSIDDVSTHRQAFFWSFQSMKKTTP